MDTTVFLRRVLPATGVFCRFGVAPKRNTFFPTIEALAEHALADSNAGRDTYFAIASFQNSQSRKAANAHALRSLVLDIDCGEAKPYLSWRDGVAALVKFLQVTALPTPMVVRSGNGLHVYWSLDVDLDPAQWTQRATRLLALTKQHQLMVDTTKVADPSLVLRPIGTHNYKDPTAPKPVALLTAGPVVTLDAIDAALPAAAAPKARKPAQPSAATKAAVAALPPANAEKIAAGCAQVRWAVQHPDQVDEPLWYALLGVAAHCADADATAVAWSAGHPDFNEDATLKKLAQWRSVTSGPTTCVHFDQVRPGGCAGCPFARHLGSPIALGARAEPLAPVEDAAPGDADTTIDLPAGFRRVAHGVVLEIDGVELDVSPFNIYPLSYGFDDSVGYEVVRFVWDRPHVGWQPLVIRHALLVDGMLRDFSVSIADQGVLLPTQKQTELFQVLLRGYIEKLKAAQTVTPQYATMGWKDECRSFVIGDTVYTRTQLGEIKQHKIRVSQQQARETDAMYTVKGDYQKWKLGVEVLHRANMYAHQFSIGVGLASVLIKFTGLNGVTVSLYGPSGSGKTLAQLMQQSLWGDPKELHFQSMFTSNAVFNRFGISGNLPMTLDEATQMSPQDVGDYLYWVSQGRDKARLKRTGGAQPQKNWALFSTLSTNVPMTSKLQVRGGQTGAQMARLVELSVQMPELLHKNPDAGRALYNVFTNNYGHAGREFMTYLLSHSQEELEAMVTAAYKEFRKEYNEVGLTGVERFWEAAYVTVYLALRISKKLGITPFDNRAVMQWAVLQMPSMRQIVDEVRIDEMDLFEEYINTYLADTLVVYYTDGSDTVIPCPTRTPRGRILGRMELRRKSMNQAPYDGTIYVDRYHYRAWSAERGGDWRRLRELAAAENCDATPASERVSLGKHTSFRTPQCYAIGVHLRHTRLRAMLYDIDARQANTALGEVVAFPKARQ